MKVKILNYFGNYFLLFLCIKLIAKGGNPIMDNYKPGGGNKPQPYIPAGHGEKSGEYTNKSYATKQSSVKHCLIRSIKMRCNFYNSKPVEKVDAYFAWHKHASIPSNGKPNSVIKKIENGYVVSERYYNNKGEAYLDIDYTCHGDLKTHPEVPHIHKWYKDETWYLRRSKKWGSFQ